jgi:general secretion pathway protein H
MMQARRSGGFTLIEILVVVAIIVVMVGLAGAQLMRGPGDLVREESERLALVLRAAREEAILQGRVYAFGAGRESYRFLRLERNGRLKATSGDDLFRPQRMPPGIVIEALRIEGAGEATQDGVVFLPSGELPAFRIVLKSGGARWSVVGAPDGTIRAQAGS